MSGVPHSCESMCIDDLDVCYCSLAFSCVISISYFHDRIFMLHSVLRPIVTRVNSCVHTHVTASWNSTGAPRQQQRFIEGDERASTVWPWTQTNLICVQSGYIWLCGGESRHSIGVLSLFSVSLLPKKENIKSVIFIIT